MSSWAFIFPPQTQVATKRQQVISQFAHLSQFLEGQQSVLLAQLERLDGDILKQQEEFDSLATGEICRFSTLIEELEEKNKRPARRLLTVRPGCPLLWGLQSHCLIIPSFTSRSLHPRWGREHRARGPKSSLSCPKGSLVVVFSDLGLLPCHP